MKILWIYKFDPDYHFDHWFHLDFVKNMRAYNPEHEIWAYGPNLDKLYYDLNLSSYNSNITMRNLYKNFQFDVVILMTKSRMFEFYRPAKFPYNKEESRNYWLPKDFNEFKTHKVLLDEDAHYELNYNWQREIGIDLVLQRHYANYIKWRKQEKDISTKWLPFSVNTNIFKPNPKFDRLNKIAFCGSAVHEIYIHRRAVIDKLLPLRLIDNFESTKKEKSYINCLQTYSAHLCGSTIYNITPAKIFEIIASGSILFTNESDKYGIQYLFDPVCYVSYKEDYSDVVEKAKIILSNSAIRRDATHYGRKTIFAKHTDEIRSKELIKILQEKFNLK